MKDEKRLTVSRRRRKNSSPNPSPSSLSFVVGLVTCSSRAEARRIAKAILTKKLAACVNIVNGLESHYWWQGRLARAGEFLLLIKTTRARVRAVTSVVKAAHSYQVPEVIFLPVVSGESKYLNWIKETINAE